MKINHSVTLPCSGCGGNATFTPEGFARTAIAVHGQD